MLFKVAKKKVMADTEAFRARLINYDKENMKEAMIEKIMPYIKDKNFKPDQVCTRRSLRREVK